MYVYCKTESMEYGHAAEHLETFTEFLLDGLPGLQSAGVYIHVRQAYPLGLASGPS